MLALLLAVACGTAAARSAAHPGASLHPAGPAPRRLALLRSGLAAVQVALAVVLLAVAGLLVRTVSALLDEDTGVDTAGVSVARLVLSDTVLFDAAVREAYVAALLQGVRGLPGVTAAGIGSNLPPAFAPLTIGVGMVTDEGTRSMLLSLGSASPGWFDALGARLVAGRGFDARDTAEAAPGIVLSASAAAFLFPDGDAVGRELAFRLPPLAGLTSPPRVVGVVSDVRYDGLDAPPPAALYVPWRVRATGIAFLGVRADGGASRLAAAVRAVARSADPALPPPDLQPFEQVVSGSIGERRLRAAPVAVFGALALGVALVGLVGLLNRLVAERRRELAVRAAYGATPGRLTAFVLLRGGLVTAVGLLTGAAGALVAARAVGGLLYGVVPADPPALLAAVGGVALVSVGACCGPAWRAGRLDPAAVLRAE